MKMLHKLPPVLIACCISLMTLPGHSGSNTCGDGSSVNKLDRDTELLFFPSYAVPGEPAGPWQVGVHVWIYEPEKNSVKRKILIDLVKNDLGLNNAGVRSKNFEIMAGYLLVDQESSKEVAVTIGGMNFCLGKTDKNGHAESIVTVQERDLGNSITRDGRARYVSFYVQASSQPNRRFAGKARIIEKKGLMVVSDIDDTIKISNVRDRQALIENTFCKPFIPVPGMANLYKNMARSGAVIHYVSASPWQLYPPLAEFLRREGFPEGLFHMKYFGFSKNLSGLFAPSESVKKPYIMNLMKNFPEIRFIFFGDSGEQDPEIYGECARTSPHQVAGIYIRNVTDETHDSTRMAAAFKGLPAGIWHLFKNVMEIDRKTIKRAVYY